MKDDSMQLSVPAFQASSIICWIFGMDGTFLQTETILLQKEEC